MESLHWYDFHWLPLTSAIYFLLLPLPRHSITTKEWIPSSLLLIVWYFFPHFLVSSCVVRVPVNPISKCKSEVSTVSSKVLKCTPTPPPLHCFRQSNCINCISTVSLLHSTTYEAGACQETQGYRMQVVVSAHGRRPRNWPVPVQRRLLSVRGCRTSYCCMPVHDADNNMARTAAHHTVGSNRITGHKYGLSWLNSLAVNASDLGHVFPLCWWTQTHVIRPVCAWVASVSRHLLDRTGVNAHQNQTSVNYPPKPPVQSELARHVSGYTSITAQPRQLPRPTKVRRCAGGVDTQFLIKTMGA